MAFVKLTPDMAADLIAGGIREQIKNLMRERLQVLRDEMLKTAHAELETICCEAAKNVVAKVTTYERAFPTNDVVVQIKFNDAEVKEERL
jgi:hypothetical protein